MLDSILDQALLDCVFPYELPSELPNVPATNILRNQFIATISADKGEGCPESSEAPPRSPY